MLDPLSKPVQSTRAPAETIASLTPYRAAISCLETLRGHRAGQYSVRINEQWRVCFRWQGEEAHDVEIVDYH